MVRPGVLWSLAPTRKDSNPSITGTYVQSLKLPLYVNGSNILNQITDHIVPNSKLHEVTLFCKIAITTIFPK